MVNYSYFVPIDIKFTYRFVGQGLKGPADTELIVRVAGFGHPVEKGNFLIHSTSFLVEKYIKLDHREICWNENLQ
jgi:hypothetical protein